jgi:paraquat-inducible protein B
MFVKATALSILLLLPMIVGAQSGSAYTWVDDEGVRHYGDRVPVEYADKEKSVINEHGVVVGHIEGKKSEEQIAAERAAAELELQKELQKRADRALLATYQNVNEIEMHRDRRVELFQAQSRVTELYLRNLDRRLQTLKQESMKYRPYNSDPSAPMVEPKLMREIEETESTIARHQQNLEKYQRNEAEIIQRFNGDIYRFKSLKGLTVTAQALPE